MSEILTVGIKAQDDATPVLERFKKSISDVSKGLESTADGASKFGNTLVDQAGKLPGVSQGFDLVGSSLKLLKNPYVEIAALIGAVGGLMVKGALSNMENIHTLEKLHASTGLTINQLNALKKVGAEYDVGLEDMAASFGKLEKNLTTNAAALKKLGVSTHDPIEAMAILADKFESTHDPVERARIGVLGFGKSWQTIAPMLAEGGDAIRKSKDATIITDGMVHRYDEMRHSQLEINRAFGAWKTALGDVGSVLLAPIMAMLASMAKKAKEMATELRSAVGASANEERLQEMATKAHMAGDRAGEVDQMKGLHDPLANLGMQGFDNAKAKKAATDKMLEELKKLGSAEQQVYLNGLAAWGADELAKYHLTLDTITGLRKQIESTKKEETKAETPDDTKAKKSQEARLQLHRDYLKASQQLSVLAQDDEFNRKRVAEENEYANQIAAAKKAFEDIGKVTEADQRELNLILEAMAKDHTLKLSDIDKEEAKKKLELRKKDIEAQIAVQTTVAAAAKHNYEKVAAEYKKSISKVGSSLEGVLVGPFDQAFKDVFSRGEFHFTRLWRSIADGFGNMLTQMMAQMAAKAAFFTILNVLTGGGAAAATGASGLLNYATAASGTPYAPGGPTLVGENGPEMVYLPRGSQVTPNDQMGGKGGGDTYNVHINGSSMSENDIKRVVISSFQSMQKQNTLKRGS